jgi:hypothetical protein
MTGTSMRRGAFTSLARGLAAAASHPSLLTTIWAWQLLLAIATAIPVFRWLYHATAYRPAADFFNQRFAFGGLAELVQFNNAPVIGILQAAAGGGLLVAALVSPLLIAAALTSLRNPSLRRPDLGSAAIALYWPFLFVTVIGRTVAVIASGLTLAALRAALGSLSDAPWEPGFLWALVIEACAAAVIAVLLLAAVDYTLVRLEADGLGGAFRAWVRGVRFAFTHPGLTLRLWAGAGVILALAVAVFVILREITSAVTTLSGPVAIGVAFVLQQAFMLTRTWLRVGLLGAEQDALCGAYAASMASVPDFAAGPVDPLDASPKPEATGERRFDDGPH